MIVPTQLYGIALDIAAKTLFGSATVLPHMQQVVCQVLRRLMLFVHRQIACWVV